MSNPTSNFNWQMPTNTDLVSQLPADFEVFGQAVDTSLADLKGGTTGQVLKKNSNTDMDFVWGADSAGMTNPMTTTGDTIYSSSGSTPARLGIGSTGQVLTVSGGLPAWSTPSATAVSGVSLYQAAQSMSNGANTNFTNFTEDYDSNSFYSTGTNITIPTAGKYLIQYSVFFAPNATGYRTMGIDKNGSTLLETDFGNATASAFNQPNGVMIRAFTFAANDVLKFYTYQTSGGSLNARAFVTITFLGA
jgi:hypothetical protein